MYRIFHGKHRIILTTIDAQKPKNNIDFVFRKPSEEQIKNVLLLSKKSTKPLKIVLRGQPKKLLKQVFSEFKYIAAGGGIVENNKGKILIMKRGGKWDLPKGKLDEGEDIETCALREIEEETGARDLSILSSLDDTFHTYYRNNKWVLKHTFWYRVKCEDDSKLKPQKSEDITHVKWKKPSKIDLKEMNTYPAIKFLLKRYLKTRKK